MVEIFYTQEQIPTDEDILSFWEMIFAPEQTVWDYEVDHAFIQKTDQEILSLFRNTVLTRDANHAFWAREYNQIIGMAAINGFTELSKQHCAELGFSVRLEHRRRGIGYQLVCAVINKAQESGFKRLESSCFADNIPAIHLLRKANFVLEGTQIGAIQKQKQLRDICLFGKLL
jgi:RimJ/RimL family protein N-acetyltransferase